MGKRFMETDLILVDLEYMVANQYNQQFNE